MNEKTDTPLIEFSDVTKRFGGLTAVDGVTIDLESRKLNAIIGPNGAGKTTFLRLLLDLIRPDDGAVYIDGRSVAASGAWKEGTGSYLDESFLLDFLSADEYFEFVGSIAEVAGPVAHDWMARQDVEQAPHHAGTGRPGRRCRMADVPPYRPPAFG